MAELNYEAIGRCKVIKGEIRQLAEKRKGLLAALADHFNSQRSGSQASDVREVNTDWSRERLNMIEELNAAIAEKVEQHDRYAPKADEPLIGTAK